MSWNNQNSGQPDREHPPFVEGERICFSTKQDKGRKGVVVECQWDYIPYLQQKGWFVLVRLDDGETKRTMPKFIVKLRNVQGVEVPA
jgi:hypothetical protein